MSVIRDDAIENALQQGIERTLRYLSLIHI